MLYTIWLSSNQSRKMWRPSLFHRVSKLSILKISCFDGVKKVFLKKYRIFQTLKKIRLSRTLSSFIAMRRILVSFVGKRWEQLFWPYQHLNFPGETARDVTMAMIIGRAFPIGKITNFTSPPGFGHFYPLATPRSHPIRI